MAPRLTIEKRFPGGGGGAGEGLKVVRPFLNGRGVFFLAHSCRDGCKVYGTLRGGEMGGGKGGRGYHYSLFPTLPKDVLFF